MRLLIIANAKFKGGLSGGDAIFQSFAKYWPVCTTIQSMEHTDYKPFVLCYLHRILLGMFLALVEPRKYDMVYSASDFLMDSLPAFIHKLRGKKWIAGFYLKAFKENTFHYWTQKFVIFLIDKFADMVIVTNPTMYDIFPNKKKTWINGGVELSLAGLSSEPKVYDAVFCGRIHKSKGIDELIEIWDLVTKERPYAKLAVIGDGDLGVDYIRKELQRRYGKGTNGIELLGYMGDERFEIYKKSKIVLYPVTQEWDHFSMAPVEAMACGCPLFAFHTLTTDYYFHVMRMERCYLARDVKSFSKAIVDYLDEDWKDNVLESRDWAKQFDYRLQAIRVFEDINKEIYEDTHYRIAGNGGVSPLRSSKEL